MGAIMHFHIMILEETGSKIFKTTFEFVAKKGILNMLQH